MAILSPYTSNFESYNVTSIAFNNAPGQRVGILSDSGGFQNNVVHFGSQGAVARQAEATVSTHAPLVSTASHSSSAVNNVAFQLDQKDKQVFMDGLSYRLFNDNYEFGIKSASEVFVEEWLLKNPILVQVCISQLYITHCKDERVLIGLLKIIAHADRQSLDPISNMISIAALSHTSVEVRECGIRAFEYWEDSSMADLLESTHVEPAWLEEYKMDVISSLKKG